MIQTLKYMTIEFIIKNNIKYKDEIPGEIINSIEAFRKAIKQFGSLEIINERLDDTLLWAIKNNQIELLIYLFKNNSITSLQVDKVFKFASTDVKEKLIVELVKNNADNIPNHYYDLLNYTSKEWRTNNIDLLIKHGFNIQELFRRIVLLNDLDSANVFIKNGLVNKEDKVVEIDYKHNNTETAKYFKKNGYVKFINEPTAKEQLQSALLHAVMYNNLEIVEELIESGMELDYFTDEVLNSVRMRNGNYVSINYVKEKRDEFISNR